METWSFYAVGYHSCGPEIPPATAAKSLNRPGMAKLVTAVEKGNVQAIIVAKLRWRGPEFAKPGPKNASSGKGFADGDGRPERADGGSGCAKKGGKVDKMPTHQILEL